MNKEEKEQWLYEAYQYTSNFDFNRLDKYEEANDDICIDDLILDYTMLYEFHKEEIERLNNIIKEQGLEDKPNYYVKGLEGSLKEYQEEIERLNNIINKIEEHFVFLKMNSTGGNKEFFEDILDFIKALRELKGSDKQ